MSKTFEINNYQLGALRRNIVKSFVKYAKYYMTVVNRVENKGRPASQNLLGSKSGALTGAINNASYSSIGNDFQRFSINISSKYALIHEYGHPAKQVGIRAMFASMRANGYTIYRSNPINLHRTKMTIVMPKRPYIKKSLNAARRDPDFKNDIKSYIERNFVGSSSFKESVRKLVIEDWRKNFAKVVIE